MRLPIDVILLLPAPVNGRGDGQVRCIRSSAAGAAAPADAIPLQLNATRR